MDKELETVKNRSFASVVSLIGQSSYSAVLGFAAFFILTLKSGSYLLGVYGTVLATMSAFSYFTNLGLGAAIMQKKHTTDTDLSSAFYLQFTLTTIAVVIGFLLTPYIFSVYKDLSGSAIPLYHALLFSFFVLSLKSVPSVLLEKELKIYQVVFAQAVENTIFYATIIILVYMGYEIGSLILAIILRSIFGLGIIYFFKPWRPKLLFSISSAKSLLAYGLPFQGNSFLALIKDDLLIIYLGSAIGLSNLGIVMFGKKYAEFSIRIIMDNLNRVAFPLFARFQENKELLEKALSKVLFYNSLLIFPAIFGGIFVFDSVLAVMPGDYLNKWQAALFSFYFFSLSSLLISQSTPFINLFNAIGKVGVSLSFMVLWTALIWVLVPIFIGILGMDGISVAFAAMALSVVLVVYTAKRYVKVSLYENIRYSIFATFMMCSYLTALRLVYVFVSLNNFLYLILSIFGGALIYVYFVYKLAGKEFLLDYWERLKEYLSLIKK